MALQALEAQFAQAADALYEKALDLNCSQKDAADSLSAVLNLRHKLLGMYGVKPDWKPGALVFAGAGAGARGATAAPGQVAWIQKLNEAMMKTLKKPMTKGEVTYTTVAVDETNKSFISTVASTHFGGEYQGAAPSFSKKVAEQEAAKAALEAEYPEFYAQLATVGAFQKPAGGQKRKATGEPAPLPEGKSLLSHYVQMLLQRSVTKDDIVYTVTKNGDGKFSATVQLPSYQGSPSYEGEGTNQKEAEMNAARVACAQLESVVAPLIEEHKAKKAAKNKENLDKLKKAQEAKKAGKVAA